jgi:hypothetical protein
MPPPIYYYTHHQNVSPKQSEETISTAVAKSSHQTAQQSEFNDETKTKIFYNDIPIHNVLCSLLDKLNEYN